MPDVDVLSGIFAVNVHSNGSAFPPKTDDGKKEIFPVKSLSGRGFHDVSFAK